MLAAPGPIAATSPDGDTVATEGSDVVHVARVVTSCAPLEAIADAASWIVCPAGRESGLGIAVVISSRSNEDTGLGAGVPTAVPVRATDAFAPETELTDSQADRVPAVLGWNCTVMTQVAPAGSDGAHVVEDGKSAVSVSLRPMVSAAVVDSVNDAVAVSPMAVWGKLRVVALTEIGVDGVATPLEQAAHSVDNKGIVSKTMRDVDTVAASSRRRATSASSRMARSESAAFPTQDDVSRDCPLF
jgi:hypothetical protein